MIGIIGAMEEEMKTLNNCLTNKTQVTIGPLVFNKGQLNGVDVVTIISGIGKVFAAMSTQSMISNFNPSLIINIGAAGSLSKDIHVSNLVIAKQVCQQDMDVSPIGFKKGEIVGTDHVWFDCDEKAITVFDKCAKKLNLTYHVANIATGDMFINSNEMKKNITQYFDAQVCEMEGASVGQVCHIYNIPFIVIRAISDEADCNSHTDFLQYVDKVILDAIELLKLGLPQL